MDEPMLYVEMLAEGTVPQKVQVSRTRPLVLMDETGNRMELESGLTYYVFECPRPTDEDLPGIEVTLVMMWNDDDGYSVEMFDDPFDAIAQAMHGWSDSDKADEETGPGPAFAATTGASREDYDLVFYRDEDTEPAWSTAIYVHVLRRRVA